MTAQMFQFVIKSAKLLPQALEALAPFLNQEPIIIEDKEVGIIQILASVTTQERIASSLFESQELLCSTSMSWDDQWALFCPYYQEGFCKIPLKDFKASCDSQLILQPGAGFGDLSHPTTQLMLELLGEFIQDQTVIDIGCGSGILALAALKMGAKKAIGLDIDLEAISHAQTNAICNNLSDRAIFTENLENVLFNASESLFLMNMTFLEQKSVRALYPDLIGPSSLLLTSGLLDYQQSAYVKWLEDLGFSCLKVLGQDQWLAFVFQKN